MFIYTDDKRIVNMDEVAVICVRGNNVVADIPHWDVYCELAHCADTKEAQQKLEELFTAIDHGRKVFYFGEFELPF